MCVLLVPSLLCYASRIHVRRSMIRSGASGYLNKATSATQLTTAIKMLLPGINTPHKWQSVWLKTFGVSLSNRS